MLSGLQQWSPTAAPLTFAARTHKTDALHYLREQLGESVRITQASKNQRADFLAALPRTETLSSNDIQQQLSKALLAVPGVEASDREYLFTLNHSNKAYKIRLTGAPRVLPRPDTHR